MIVFETLEEYCNPPEPTFFLLGEDDPEYRRILHYHETHYPRMVAVCKYCAQASIKAFLNYNSGTTEEYKKILKYLESDELWVVEQRGAWDEKQKMETIPSIIYHKKCHEKIVEAANTLQRKSTNINDTPF
jgi:hypothetical protein